ncbi:MAG: hypothetical protein XD72_2197 [Methanothrix harundinacea]|uniref:Uncharacterized protein n=1 Tax=Methanothrix harundinacea TaxID=301375 RepID=A0A117LEY2_9EURY|nr:MAG: hypothetical protein XD72_2197 [Methanothrix harundinacea]
MPKTQLNPRVLAMSEMRHKAVAEQVTDRHLEVLSGSRKKDAVQKYSAVLAF